MRESEQAPKSSQARSSRRPLNSGEVEQRSINIPLEREPWVPGPYDSADIAAFRALREGRAEPYQQQMCLEWIIYISGTYENAFRPGPDGSRATDFAGGKQWVGQQIVKLINMPMKQNEQGEQG